MGTDMSEAAGLYVSVPFCRAKCSFCNFSSDVGTPARLERYVDSLCREIRGARTRSEGLGLELPQRVDTVYFGGGTPSLLQPAQLRQIFRALRESFALDADAEITMESAPGQIAGDLLEEALQQGVNRVSLGVQSFIDSEAASVGRLHTAQEALDEVTRLRRAGVAEIGADLIAGLPYQTRESWQLSLETAVTSDITHLSVYMLEVDEESRLGREVIAGGARFHAHAVGADDLIADLYETACAWLPGHGFAQYEISNFARKGVNAMPPRHESRHNRKYWERAPYLGFGLDAHSMLLRAGDRAAVRFANSAEMHDFDMGVPGAKPLAVSEREAFEETLFLGLRLTQGIDCQRWRAEWPREWVAEVEGPAAELTAEGLMLCNSEALALTLKGRLLSNEVFGHLLAGVPA